MKGVFFYNRQDGSFSAYEHNLDDFLARTIANEFTLQGKEAYIIHQPGRHEGSAANCERCQLAGVDFFQRLQDELDAQPSEIPGWLQRLRKSGPSPFGPRAPRRLPLPERMGVGVFSLVAILLIAALGYLFTAGPLAPYLDLLTESIQPTAAPLLPTATATVPPPSPSPVPSATHRPTRTPAPTEAAELQEQLAPSPTLPAEDESGCIPVEDVTVDMAGQELCVSGVVTRSYSKDNIFYIVFTEKQGAFFMLSYDRVWNAAEKGACIRAVGKVQVLGSAPVMLFDYKTELSLCP